MSIEWLASLTIALTVFLRILEYYSGILFLTTNRIGSFDEAFKSRAHLPLFYPPLDLESTIKLWENSLNRIERRNQEKRAIEKQKEESGTLDRPVQIRFEREKLLEFAADHYSKNLKRTPLGTVDRSEMHPRLQLHLLSTTCRKSSQRRVYHRQMLRRKRSTGLQDLGRITSSK